MDLITVVVPVYNAEKTIEKCVDSLLSQSYSNIEIILINDCSTDRSLDICKNYADKHGNIKVLSNQKNSGVSYTRNRGIDDAHGKYICFVDSDDYVETEYLEILYNIYQEYNLFPICGFVFHDEYSGVKPVEYRWSGGSEKVSLGDAFRLYGELYLTALWNKLFINKIIKEKCVRFDTALSMGEDIKFTVEYLLKAGTEFVYVTDKMPYHYMKLNNTSLMADFAKGGMKSCEELLNTIKSLAEKYNSEADKIMQNEIENKKNTLIYFIMHDKTYSKKEKLEKAREIKPDFSNSDYNKYKISMLKEKIFTKLFLK